MAGSGRHAEPITVKSLFLALDDFLLTRGMRFYSSISSVDFRLVGGDLESSVGLEVMHGGIWGPVCQDTFSIDAANMVCHT